VPSGRRAASRGVTRRNAKLAALRDLVSQDWAILAVDLASKRQAAVLCDHDSVVLGRRMFTGWAWCIEQILAWAEPVAPRAGSTGLVPAASRPDTGGSRWR
jgi:transposase